MKNTFLRLILQVFRDKIIFIIKCVGGVVVLHFGQFCDAYLPVVDGVIMVVKNYAEILNAKYGTCMVVAPAAKDYKDGDAFEMVRVKSIPIPTRYPYRYAMPSIDKSAREKIETYPLDLIHTHSPFGISQYGLKVAKKRNIPIISTFHSKFYDEFKLALKSEKLARMVVDHAVEYYNQMDQVWAVNRSTAETLREYGYKGNIEIAYNGSDFAYPENAEALRQSIIAEYQIPTDKPMFLFVGQQIWHKNIRLIIEAMELLKQQGFAYTMVLVGEGSNANEIKKLVAEKGLEEQFLFTGVLHDREKLTGFYLAADLFLFPSLYDNAPLVVKEASSLRTPSITVSGSNAAEGVVDGENGFLTEENAISIAEKIKKIYTEQVDLTAVGNRAQQTLASSWETIVEDVYGRYVELIAYKNKQL